MRILINGLVVSIMGGHNTYFKNFIPHLGRLGAQHEFLLLHSEWQDMLKFNLPANFTRVVDGPKKRSLTRRVIWEQLHLPRLLNRMRVDVMFSPVPSTMLFSPCPTVIAIRNLNPFSSIRIKDWHYWVRNTLLRLVSKAVAARADYLIFVSNTSREIALKHLRVSPEKAVTIYHGVGAQFFDTSNVNQKSLVNATRPYILTTSTIYHHKNYLRMVEAFSILCKSQEWNYDYVIVGGVGDRSEYERLKQRIKQPDLQGRVHLLGEVPYTDLPIIYRNAQLFVYPSLLETFGHPLVEAMAAGTPIVAAKSSCLPEIGGDAAIYFDPYNVNEIANIVRAVLIDDNIRNLLIANGQSRVNDFSWEKSSQQMLDLFISAARSD